MWSSKPWFTTTVIAFTTLAHCASAQVRLIGITGNQTEGTWNGIPQESLFEIDTESGNSTFLTSLGFAFESQSIGYNADDGLLYRTAGSDTFRCSMPSHHAFNDTQYMEKMVASDLAADSPIDTTVVFNADPLGRPKPGPRPDWLYPQQVRVSASDPCDDPDRENSNDEYDALRGLAYSPNQNIFFGTDLQHGLFKITPDGDSNYWVASPRDSAFPAKSVAIRQDGNIERLFISSQMPTAILGDRPTAELLELDSVTGQLIRAVPLQGWHENSDGSPESVDGIVALAFHPVTHELYGISKGREDAADARQRELVKIDIHTGVLTLVGDASSPGLGLNLSSLAFVPEPNSLPLTATGILGLAAVFLRRRHRSITKP